MSFKLTSIGDTKCPEMAMLQRLYKDTSQYPKWDISSANWDMNEVGRKVLERFLLLVI